MIHPRSNSLRFLFSLACLSLATPAAALDLAWPETAELSLRVAPSLGSFEVATGPFAETGVPTHTTEGALSHQVWHVPGQFGDPLLLLGLIRDQLDQQGFDIGFTCADASCGGFDFRYNLPIAEGPAMHVDLGNFHYLTATRSGASGTTTVALTVSHGGQQGYAHLAIITPPDDLAAEITPSTRALAQDFPPADMIDALLTNGRVALDDLIFERGASALSGAQYESLVTLAAFLTDNPDRNAVLVGHTDAEGSLETNITLSRARANAVRQFLIDELGVLPSQLQAEGIGFLSPRAPNSSEDGRQANRRVEVVLADIN